MRLTDTVIYLRRTGILLAALVFAATLFTVNLSWLFGQHADALQLQSRKVELTSSLAGDVTTGLENSETNGSDATHTFTFTQPTHGTAANIGSLEFEYCTTAIGTCTAPTNLDVNTGTSITTQTANGSNFTNLYTLDTSTGNCANANVICATNATGNTFPDGNEIIFAFDDIRNPDYDTSGTDPDDNTFFVRVTTYSDAGWSTLVDEGTVASAITVGITITSRVVETLGFSVASEDDSVGLQNEGTDCSPMHNNPTGALGLGDPGNNDALDINQAYDAYSGFRLYTNSANGTSVQYRGDTLTKGTDDIDAIGGTATASTVDAATEQFGLAIDTNGLGAFDGSGGGFGAAGQLALNPTYADGDGAINGAPFDALFAFVPNTFTELANSATGAYAGSAANYVACDTAAVRYIGNISALTPAGTYTTTIVYYAVPTY